MEKQPCGWQRFLGLAVILAHATPSTADTARTTLDIWPGKVPGEVGSVGEEKAKTATQPDGTTVITSLTNVSKPTLTVCRPEAAKNTGVAVLVFPGGGYNILAWDHEGEQVAHWLNSIGVTAAVLKYRVPRREGTPKESRRSRPSWMPSGRSAWCGARRPMGGRSQADRRAGILGRRALGGLGGDEFRQAGV